MGIIRNIFNSLKSISFGLAFLLLFGFMFIRTDIFFPVHTMYWKDKVLTSILFLILFLGIESAASKKFSEAFFQKSFLREGLKFLIAAAVSFAVFYILFLLVGATSLPQISKALSGTPIAAIFLYAILVAFPEQWIFFRRIPLELQSRGWKKIWINLFSIIAWALYHSFLGKSFWVLLFYIPLGLIFSFVRDKFSPDTDSADAGVHFSWDISLLAFFPDPVLMGLLT